MLRLHASYLCVQDYRRRYNLEPIVKSDLDKELEKGRTRAFVSVVPERMLSIKSVQGLAAWISKGCSLISNCRHDLNISLVH